MIHLLTEKPEEKKTDMSVKRRNTNASSLLLNPDENETLFNILGRGCVTLASGVCQLYTADAPTTHKWSKRFCGVVCFVKDNPKRSYYIRLYDIKKDALIWEQEIYNQFKYKAPREYFHTFEADSVQAGLNFASEDEAIKFKNAVEQKLLERHQKKLERKRQHTTVHHGSQSQASSPVVNSAPAQAPVVNIDIKSSTNTVGKSKSKGKDKKKKLTKDDISTPTAFRHVSHVGWDPTKGFDMNNLDNDMKSLFEQVGITNTTDVDKETVDFIYDFVEQHGGIDKIKEEMKKRPPPPPSFSGPPAPPPSRNTGPPPAPLSRAGPAPPQRGGPPPPPPSRSAQPPPTPARSIGSPPAPPSFTAPAPPPQSAKAPPPPAPTPGVPPPPPPPAPPAAPPPPPAAPLAPAAPSGVPATGAGRGALLDSIRAGTTLKHNTEENRSSGSSGGGDARSNLMDAIRSGKQLKAVEKDEKPEAEPGQEGGIVGALAMALANRQKQLQMTDDEDEDDDELDDEDEWDD